MSRTIRRVPMGWEHPKNDNGVYMPVLDEFYEVAVEEWMQNDQQWQRGEHELQTDPDYADYKEYGEYETLPDPQYHIMAKWDRDDQTLGWVMYQDVSEGTPLTPVFATKEELIEFLCTEQDYWGEGPYSREAAERFVEAGWAPSMIFRTTEDGHSSIWSGVHTFDMPRDNV